MAKDILIIGESGTGKSTSFRNLPPEETFIISCSKDEMPFRGFSKGYTKWTKDNPDGNFVKTHNASTIVQVLKWVDKNRDDIKYIVVEDGNYVMQNTFIARANEKGYQKFTDIGVDFSSIITTGKALSSDKVFILTMHPQSYVDESGVKKQKAKTVGNLVDNYLTIEGMFNMVLFTGIEKTENGLKHYFYTKSDGTTTAKAPMEMLEEKEPNDLAIIIKKMNEYY